MRWSPIPPAIQLVGAKHRKASNGDLFGSDKLVAILHCSAETIVDVNPRAMNWEINVSGGELRNGACYNSKLLELNSVAAFHAATTCIAPSLQPYFGRWSHCSVEFLKPRSGPISDVTDGFPQIPKQLHLRSINQITSVSQKRRRLARKCSGFSGRQEHWHHFAGHMMSAVFCCTHGGIFFLSRKGRHSSSLNLKRVKYPVRSPSIGRRVLE